MQPILSSDHSEGLRSVSYFVNSPNTHIGTHCQQQLLPDYTTHWWTTASNAIYPIHIKAIALIYRPNMHRKR